MFVNILHDDFAFMKIILWLKNKMIISQEIVIKENYGNNCLLAVN